MSTVTAFATARPRRAQRPLADVVPIAGARAARADRQAVAGELGRARVADPVPLRLTRRGRAFVRAALVLCLAAAIGLAVLLIGHQALAGDQSRPVPATYRVVLPGETLWSIAGQVAPGADRRDTVDRIVEFNAMPSVAVQVGQRVAIPGDVSQH